MNRSQPAQKAASSFSEIALVVASIVILAAVSIPQMSRASRITGGSTVADGLAALRTAIDQYAAEHGGAFPTAAEINRQLTLYTDLSGAVSETKTIPYVYGPYLRSIPVLGIGIRRGSSRIAADDAQDVGWLYTEASGRITANTAQMDETEGMYRGH